MATTVTFNIATGADTNIIGALCTNAGLPITAANAKAVLTQYLVNLGNAYAQQQAIVAAALTPITLASIT